MKKTCVVKMFRPLLAMLLLMGATAVTAEAPLAPNERIQKATDELLVVIEQGKGYYEKDPERFYQAVEEVVDPLFDFNNFTRRIMGPFGQRDYYLSLDEAQRAEYKKDYYRFVERFKKGLIATYSKGMLAFSGQSITVLALSEQAQQTVASGGLVVVEQHIKGSDKTYTAQYSMSQNKKGEWMVRNVVIESVNIGSLYRSQFLSAMKAADNDFSQVVDAWVVDSQDLKKATDHEK